jgi:hypothetical protein
MTVLLPDLSEFQPSADMAGIKRANGGAAIIRLAYGDQHPDHVGTRLRANARMAGFPFLGLYQYLVAGQDVAAQARAFCALAGKLAPHEIPVLDLEEGSGDQFARAAQWMAIVGGELGRAPWLYSGESFAKDHGLAPIFDGSLVHTWVAAYRTTEPALGHTLWQSTNGVTGANITAWPGAGRCDTSIYHGTLEQLAALVDPPKRKPAPHVVTHVTAGHLSLHDLAAKHKTTAPHILYLTSDHSGGFPPEVAGWVSDLFAGVIDAQADVPAGLHLRVPVVP